MTSIPSGPSKRTGTTKTLLANIAWVLAHLEEVRAAHDTGRVNETFAKRIVLAVTNVNGCRYCDYFHARNALELGIDEIELIRIYAGEFGDIPAEQTVAIAFAQHYAEQQGKPDLAAWQRLYSFYGPDTAQDILAIIHTITIGNLLGNSGDALLLRLRGAPMPGSRLSDELGVLLLTLTVLPGAMIGGKIGNQINRLRRG